MIDDNFYLDLEYKIGEALENSPNEEARKFWCDGVTPGSEHEYTKKYVNDNRKIVMTAYLVRGISNDHKYELILNFGRKALSRYARGLDISVCIPESPGGDWFDIDISTEQIWVQLD